MEVDVPTWGVNCRNWGSNTFSGVHKRAELLRNPCILGGSREKSGITM